MNNPLKPSYPLAEMLLPITGSVTQKNNHFTRNSIGSPFKSGINPMTCKANLNKTTDFFNKNNDS
jgi:hypothetical protein